MKSILLHIGGDPSMEARLQVALDIARANGAHLTCCQAVSFEVYAPGDFYGNAMAAAMPRIREAADAVRAKVEASLAKEDVPWTWQFFEGRAEDRLLEQSPLHDVIVIGPDDIGAEGARRASDMAGELALKAAVPVLVVPQDQRGLDVSAPIIVAWNGSAEACVALRAAVPLLKLASNVILATVEEQTKRKRYDFPPIEGAQYLSRHGIEAECVEIERGKAKVSDTLFSEAQRHECSMIVMGAYGHSRFAERLLGGVTRRSLTDPQMPIFMAH